MYQAFPGGDGDREQSASAAPQSVRRAVRLMYAGAVASIVYAAIEVAAVSWVKSRMRQAGDSSAQLTTLGHVFIGVFIAFGLVSAALWIWMAQSCRTGKGWARITSTVFFAISTIFTLGGLANGSVSTSTSTSTTVDGTTTTATSSSTALEFGVFGVVVWLIGLGAIIFLWQRSSSDYFNRGAGY